MPEEEKDDPNVRFGLKPGETAADYDFDVDKQGTGPTSKDDRVNWDGQKVAGGEWYD